MKINCLYQSDMFHLKKPSIQSSYRFDIGSVSSISSSDLTVIL